MQGVSRQNVRLGLHKGLQKPGSPGGWLIPQLANARSRWTPSSSEFKLPKQMKRGKREREGSVSPLHLRELYVCFGGQVHGLFGCLEPAYIIHSIDMVPGDLQQFTTLDFKSFPDTA